MPARKTKKESALNPMQEIVIDKVVLNIGVGQAGDRLTKAVRVLEML